MRYGFYLPTRGPTATREAVLAMAREGADIASVYLEEHKDADETVRLVEREGRRAVKFAGDVGDEHHVPAGVEPRRVGVVEEPAVGRRVAGDDDAGDAALPVGLEDADAEPGEQAA